MSQVTVVENAYDAFLITPSDANPKITEGKTPCPLYVGVLGNIRVLTAKGTDITFEGVQGFFPVQVVKVFQTGTSADNIIGLV